MRKKVITIVIVAVLIILCILTAFAEEENEPIGLPQFDYAGGVIQLYSDGVNPSLADINYFKNVAENQSLCGGLNTRMYLAVMWVKMGVVYGVFTNTDLTNKNLPIRNNKVEVAVQPGNYDGHTGGRFLFQGSSGTDFSKDYATYTIAMFDPNVGWILASGSTSGSMGVYLDDTIIYTAFNGDYNGIAFRVNRPPTNFTPGTTNRTDSMIIHEYWQAVKDYMENGAEAGSEVDTEQIYNDGFQDGYQVGYQQGHEVGYGEGVDDGVEAGRSMGYEEGYEEGYETGYSKGHTIGYTEGYDKGKVGVQIDIPSVITSIPESVRIIFDKTFDFDIFGFNVSAFIMTIALIAVTIVVTKIIVGIIRK